MTRTGPASLVTGAGGVSVDGPIATESIRPLAARGGAAEVDVEPGEEEVIGSVLDENLGSIVDCEVDIVASTDCSGFIFSLLVPCSVDANVDPKGEVAGIETSLRSPPSLFGASRSLIVVWMSSVSFAIERPAKIKMMGLWFAIGSSAWPD